MLVRGVKGDSENTECEKTNTTKVKFDIHMMLHMRENILPNYRFQQKQNKQSNKRNLEGSIFGVLFGRNGQ